MKKLEEKYSIKPIVEFDIVEDDAMDLVLGGATCSGGTVSCPCKGKSCFMDCNCLLKFA
ncbi:MAG TPA: hypothetical protein IAC93_02225 [Candidatus Limisoma gallistercoris]|nr:hypothetical protein [Candidatus Limisoma gallistercoris]